MEVIVTEGAERPRIFAIEGKSKCEQYSCLHCPQCSSILHCCIAADAQCGC